MRSYRLLSIALFLVTSNFYAQSAVTPFKICKAALQKLTDDINYFLSMGKEHAVFDHYFVENNSKLIFFEFQLGSNYQNYNSDLSGQVTQKEFLTINNYISGKTESVNTSKFQYIPNCKFKIDQNHIGYTAFQIPVGYLGGYFRRDYKILLWIYSLKEKKIIDEKTLV